MFETSWVVISVLYTGWNFFTLICCIVCLKRPKINEKEAGVGQFKKLLGLFIAETNFQDKGIFEYFLSKYGL